MANRNVERYEAIERANALRQERNAAYRAMYTETDAQRLSNAFIRYPWVNPQILVSTVLSGNDDALEPIAEYAAFKMAEAGYSPVEISRQDDLRNKYNEEYLMELYRQDQTGGVNVDAARQDLNSRIPD